MEPEDLDILQIKYFWYLQTCLIGPVDRNSAFLDAGIFTMNLLYALHYKHIAACPLNADMGSKLVKEIHKRLNIPMSEIPVCFITIGNASKEFLVANSQRIDIENVYSIV